MKGLFLLDRVAVGGAVAESVIRALVPGYRERIVRHEAGHFLVAYLLGCPVQGCLLDPLTVGRFASSGAQGGTVFADPTFAKGMSSGKLTRSAIDRFTIVLMGGIAAESIQYGNSEGGSADEGVMIGILSTIAPPFDMDQIKSQALWSATQAVLIINEHKEAYEALVVALTSGAELGECVRAMEKELAKKPLPGDVRREDLKPRSPADEVRGMVVRRMSQRYWANQEERAAAAVASAGTGASSGSVASRVADNDKAMLDLQRRVEDLERTIAGGKSIDDQGMKKDDGGVWMNDLKALREDIKATNDKNNMESALDAVLADDPATAVASSPGAVLLPSPPSSAATMPAVSTPSTPSTPEPSQQDKQKMTDIDIKTAENAKRMADVEARLRKFDEKHPR